MIRVNDDYVINVDAYNFIPAKDMHKCDKKGNPIYSTLGYASCLEYALEMIASKMSADALVHGEYSLAEAIEIIKHNNKEMRDMIWQIAK